MPRKLVGILTSTNQVMNGVISTSGKQGPMGPPGPPGPPGPGGGVNSWNTRQGEVMPQAGDYNLGMVGAELLTNSDINDI